MNAQRQLSRASDGLSATFEKLSSGLRINKASDDAAGLAISSSLKTNARVFTQAIRNINDGVSTLNIAEGALGELRNITVRQLELAEQSANGTYSTKQRKVMDTELNTLVKEWNRITQSTSFNGIQILDGNLRSSGSSGALQIQAGADSQSTSQISIGVGDQVARNVGDQTFGTAVAILNGPDTFNGAIVADVNNDGKLDLIGSTFSSNYIAVSLGNGDGTFQPIASYVGALNTSGDNNARGIALQDVNGDGIADLIGMSSNYSGTASNTVNILLGNGNGTYKAMQSYDIGAQDLISFDFGDFNGDGTIDIVTGNNSAAGISILYGNGNGSFRAKQSAGAGSNGYSVKSGDFNNDDKIDFVSTVDGFVNIYSSNGNGTFSTQSLTATGFTTGTSVELDDLDGDGNLDILAANYNGASSALYVFKGNGNGTFQAAKSYASNSSLLTLGKADFNGDGFTDIYGGNAVGGGATLLINNGDGTFKANISIPNYGNTIVAGDLNGDGAVDFIGNLTGGGATRALGNTTKVTSIARLDITSQSSARLALETLQFQLTRVSSELGAIGAAQSRFQVASNTLHVSNENYLAAASRITDVDIAQESSELTRKQILQQAASSVLAQANQQPQLALQLLRG